MKSKLFLYAIISTISFGTVYAYVDCRDTVTGCTVSQLIEIGDNAPTTKEDRVNAYKAAITKINAKIAQLELTQSGELKEGKNCLTLKNNLWIGKTDDETNGEVTLLQQYLIDKGYLQLSSTSGYYGNATALAVVRMQKALGMNFVTTSSGVGVLTRSKIQCQQY
jgi:peptidoglycan hydrolase-like protein with peptidoglycan-binding domain